MLRLLIFGSLLFGPALAQDPAPAPAEPPAEPPAESSAEPSVVASVAATVAASEQPSASAATFKGSQPGVGSGSGTRGGSSGQPGAGSGVGSGAGSGAGSGSASQVPFGQVITTCTVPNSFALSFDDGSFQFTMTLLDLLRTNGLKATFFVNGDNFDKIENRAAELKTMLQDGHQIGSHTFAHPDLTNITDDEVRSEMTKLDDAFVKIIGMSPTYMRPPFFSTNEKVLQILGEMQYHVINADIDTKDFENTTPETNDIAFENFKKGLAEGGTISLMHDVHNTTVNQLMVNVVPVLKESGRKSLTVGECLGDPPENWYRSGPVGGGNQNGGQNGGLGGGGRTNNGVGGQRSRSPGYDSPKRCGCGRGARPRNDNVFPQNRPRQ